MEKQSGAPLEWLSGGGEITELIRSIDWGKSPLGPIEKWPQSLRTTVSLCLSSNFPINIIWGPEAIQIYNEGYSVVCGAAHPRATGQPYNVTWASAWPVIGGPFESARNGQASYLENQRMFLERNGYLEETFFTFSLSPIRDENGGVAGLFHPVTETTALMLSERRTRALRDTANKVAGSVSLSEASRLILETLSSFRFDLPFLQLYLMDEVTGLPTLSGQFGLPENIHDLVWPFAEALKSNRPLFIEDARKIIGEIPCADYPESMKSAYVIPIWAAGHEGAIGFATLGLSTRLPHNEAYEIFISMLATTVSAALNDARAYAAEKKKAAELAEIDRAKTAFFSNVSHEFRTPLTLMLGPLEDSLAEAGGAGTPQRRRQELIYRNARRLLRLVNSLLEFSRIEAGRLRASFRPTDIATTTTQWAGMFQSLFEKAGLKFTIEIEKDLPLAYLDRDMWEKIVLNLLSNAFKFTLQGEITVSLRRDAGDFLFSVADTGTGIAEAELPRLFERFHRIEGAKGRSYEGTGIGLALIQELARLQGGEISVVSQPGKGSTFTVRIPMGKAHLEPSLINDDASPDFELSADNSFVLEATSWLETPGEAKAKAASTAMDGQRRWRVVVADDNADMRLYIGAVLDKNFDVRMFSDGEAAFAAIAADPPDLIVSDVMMPKLDGFGLIAKVRGEKALSAIPIVLLSARAGEESRVEGIEAGADDYLVKPFSSQELVAKLRALLDLGKLRAKYQEDLLYSVFNQINVGIRITKGPDHVFELANPTYSDLFFPGRDLLGKPLLEAVPEIKGQGFVEVLNLVYHRGESYSGTEQPLMLKQRDGTTKTHYITFVYQPKYNLRGEIDGIVSVVHDVTETVLARQKAQKLADDLMESLKVRDEFLSIASHELKTPITSLKLNLQLTQRAIKPEQNSVPTPAQLRRSLDICLRQTDRLANLVDDLLNVARVQRGKLDITPGAMNLTLLVKDLVERFSVSASQTSTDLSLDVDEDIQGVWDESRIEQVFTNLITNALKYAPGKPIEVRLKRRADGVIFSVKDRGPGIEKDNQLLIFDRFERAGMSRNISGLGLGLFLSKAIVESHGGKIGVFSRPGEGATFSVELPLNSENPG